MDTAHAIAAINPAGLHDFIKAVLRPLQAEQLLCTVEIGLEPTKAEWAWDFFGPAVRDRLFDADGATWRPINLDPSQFPVELGRDLVLPSPWNPQCFVSALATIGSKKGDVSAPAGTQRWQGAWREDAVNHAVVFWLPWRIGFVHGGNHSITAGVLAGEGRVTPDAVNDMAYLFDELRADGEWFYCIRSGRKLAALADPRLGATFEIGRLIHHAGEARGDHGA